MQGYIIHFDWYTAIVMSLQTSNLLLDLLERGLRMSYLFIHPPCYIDLFSRVTPIPIPFRRRNHNYEIVLFSGFIGSTVNSLTNQFLVSIVFPR